jgi:Txe/YoeB family toxin of toxin-antitoxin system
VMSARSVVRDATAGELPGAWSRRIDDEHRLVYIVTETEIIILAARYRY